MQEVSASQAIHRLRQLGKLDHCIVNERLDLRTLIESGDEVVSALTFSNCHFREIYSTLIKFTDVFVFQECVVDQIDLYGTYFLNGFIIENNIFNKYIQFMHADHGRYGGQMRLVGNIFNNFVDFEDSGFYSKIEITNNSFTKGTNLLADVQLAPTYTQEPIIANNEGDLKIATFFGTML